MFERIEESDNDIFCSGDHTCLLYSSLEDYRMIAIPYIIKGLQNNEQVICVIDEYKEQQILKDLYNKDINASEYISSGQLIITSISNTYRGAKEFNPDDTLNHWKKQIELLRGLPLNGIRVMGEATFSLDGKYESLEKLIEYELRVNIDLIPLFKKQQYLCVYNQKLFPSEVLQRVIQAHPKIINQNKIIKENHKYTNPSKQLVDFKKDLQFYEELGIRGHEADINLERTLRRDEEKLHFVLSGIGDGLWDWNIEDDTIYFDDNIHKILGYSKEELDGGFDNLKKIIHPDDLSQLENTLTEHISGKTANFQGEFRIRKSNNQWIWVMNRGKGISKTENGDIVRVIGIYKDITKSKEAEINLTESEERFRELTENIDEVFWIGENDKVLYISPAFEKIWGRKCNDIIENKDVLLQSIHPEDQERIIESFRKEIEENYGKFNQQYRIIKTDGTIRWIWSRTFPIYDKNKKKIRVVGIAEDITKLKDYEESLKKAKENADLANKAKSIFLANMSHEIRTPMNGMLGMIQLAQISNSYDEINDYLDIAKKSADTLLTVINDILDYSKIEAEKMNINKSSFKLTKVIDEVTTLFSTNIRDKKLKILTNIDCNIPDTLLGDPHRIRQILSNIVGNAIKFTNKGMITVSVDINEDINNEIELQFIVGDTGIGIPRDKIDQLFKSFSQIENSITRTYGGTGLGLVISKELINLMGGDIWVESKEGIGSKFYFTIRLNKKYNKVANIKQEKPSLDYIDKSSKTDFKILLAEDDKTNQILFEKFFKSKGISLTIAKNGEEVIERVNTDSYHIILMDIQMPVMSGMEATTIIRKNEEKLNTHIPIIALTAYATEEHKENFLKSGFDGYIAKPVDLEELYNRTMEWIKN